MTNPFEKDTAAARLAEDELYAFVYEEIQKGQMDTAAQARAIAEGGANEGEVRAAYIKHRIARIKAEIEVSVAEVEHEKEFQKKKLQSEEKRRVEDEYYHHKQNKLNNKEEARQKSETIAAILILGFVIYFYIWVFF
jgi:hypothetical protein